jgi:hypothetical protein
MRCFLFCALFFAVSVSAQDVTYFNVSGPLLGPSSSAGFTETYTLPPDKLERAKTLYELDIAMFIFGTVCKYSLFLVLLYFGVVARYCPVRAQTTQLIPEFKIGFCDDRRVSA